MGLSMGSPVPDRLSMHHDHAGGTVLTQPVTRSVPRKGLPWKLDFVQRLAAAHHHPIRPLAIPRLSQLGKTRCAPADVEIFVPGWLVGEPWPGRLEMPNMPPSTAWTYITRNTTTWEEAAASLEVPADHRIY
ncbi:hypothetical protein CSOJ01_03383 [Colletotrichum sojae]|uniref:Uncharacterized protein n=1 Tax=Colletotrichum sojae TaxID=2175907 RepID=A0A8H6N143_9PEZI|nr:hypothetical protein CSOJ01_03383 [Colletotrichum sojae]